VGRKLGIAVACIQAWFENLDLLLGDSRTAKTTDEFLRFAAEHRACDHLNAAVL
jgi:hypothetical protein